MRRTRGRVVEIDSLADFDRRLGAGARRLAGWRVEGVDLLERAAVLGTVEVAGAIFVGCRLLDPGGLRERGAVVLDEVAEVPVELHRTALYSARELYDTADYPASRDARALAWTREHDPDTSLARALHDHAIDEALGAWVVGRRLVGVMGGHALRRGSAEYAAAARLGHRLGRSCVVATGGGPGAMEAANLGALTSRAPGALLEGALRSLAEAPSYVPDVSAWVAAALAVIETVPDPAESLGIPTWHYGHEPTNAFATAIAKYFRNATREAILLEVCDAGIVFLPGAAGTVQEIFQDACENYYADASSLAPMVLVGVDHWTRELPAWPLLRALARDRAMADRVHLADSLDEAAALIG